MAQDSALVGPVSDREAGWLSRFVFWMARRKLRALSPEPRVPGPLRVMAHHPAAMLTYGAFEAGLERCQRVPARLKSLAMIRAATLVGCPF
jgi:hypothetical protein